MKPNSKMFNSNRHRPYSYLYKSNHNVKEGRDNKDVLVGGGGDNKNKIRYPKKCRKTAWKRFYKLFPHLKK